MRRTSALALLALAAGIRLPAQDVNIALGRPVSASGPTYSGQIPENLTDGTYTNQTHPLASSGTLGFHYDVDLEGTYQFGRIVLFNRTGCCPERLSNYRVSLFADSSGSPGARRWSADIRTDGSHSGDGGQDVLTAGLDPDGTFAGRFIRIENLSDAAYNPQIAELEAYVAPLPVIELFGVDHGNITRSGNPSLPTSATLSWRVDRFDTLSMAPGIGPVAGPTGSVTVAPLATTTYTLTATNSSGEVQATVTVGVDEVTVDPVITELMAANTTTLEDGYGDDSDWIEVHNPNPFTLNLEGYHLTDTPGDLARWRFPSVPVPGGSYIVVFASGKAGLPGEPHASFELSREGEYLALVAADGSTVLQQFPADYPATATYPPQREDLSYGISSGGSVGFMSPATPGAPNGTAFQGFVEDTSFFPDRGFHDAPIDVTISTPTAGAQIRYTTDGSEPTATRGTVYGGPIRVAATTVLRAAAFRQGFAPTDVDTHTYIFLDGVIASSVMDRAITQDPVYAPQMRAALTDLPTLSLVASGTVNDTSEVRASVELILPDGTAGFQEDAGVKYYGGAFTSFEKKNFRLYFRGVYGATKLRYPLFSGHDRGVPAAAVFDQLELRGGSHDMNQRGFYMSNRFTDDTMLDMGNLNPHGRFVHLYRNGTYWGQYHLRERWNAAMLAEYLGGSKDDYEAINGNWNVGGWAEPGVPYDGDGSAWARIKSLRADYEAVRPYLDVPHYVDYMLMFCFGDAETEYRCVGPKGPGSGFKFFLNDADGFLRNVGNRLSMGMPGRSDGDGPGSLFSMLLWEGHPDYRILLGDRIHEHFFDDGAMTPASNRERLVARCDQVQRAFIAESARWGYRTPASWTSAKDAYLGGVLPSRTATVVAQFRAAGLYPSVEAPEIRPHGGAVAEGFTVTMDAPAGTIYCTTDGSDPRLPGGAVSPTARTVTSTSTTVPLVGGESRVSFLVPADGGLGAAWTLPDFDDAAWTRGGPGAGAGYDADPTYLPHIDVSLDAAMRGVSPTVYLRYEFEVADPSPFGGLELSMRYDDGYVAYLNGEAIASRNAPASSAWDSAATASHADNQAVDFEPADLTHPAPALLLRAGTNVLAIQGLNSSVASTDMLIEPELAAVVPGEGSGVAIERSSVVKARALAGGAWSALTQAVFGLDTSGLRVTEVMYHPPPPPEGSPYGQEDLEFIELVNVGETPLNLTGITISSGATFTFPDGDASPEDDLLPGEVVLVVGDLEAFELAHDTSGLYIAGEYRGKLDNAGDRIVLRDRLGRVLVDFAFSDAWSPETDGAGSSLEIVDPAGDPAAWSAAGSWRASALWGGSPGIVSIPAEGGRQRPGDLNQDGALDIADAIGLLLHLFASPASLPCGDGTLGDAGNRLLLDFDRRGGVDLSDAVGILQYLFRGGPPPALGSGCVELLGCPDACSR